LRPKLLIATNNPGKMREYRALLKGVPFEMVSPLRIGIRTTVAEVGRSFEENARLKAEVMAKESKLLTLADDSGLEVDALGGEPGVMSARYAGENVSDAERVRFLLTKLKEVPEGKRNARFRCVIAIACEGHNTLTCAGECKGYIALEPRGQHGFGYDPIFFVPEMGKTMAEIPATVKNKISHRAQAAKKARRLLFEIARRQSGR
jgi:XTP/dITP diphosphohydrolase